MLKGAQCESVREKEVDGEREGFRGLCMELKVEEEKEVVFK